MPKRIEFSFSVLQAVFLGIGGVITLLLIFALGFMVGKEAEGVSIFDKDVRSDVVKMKIEPLPQPEGTIHAAVNQGKKPVMNNITSKPVITFYDTLTKSKGKDREPQIQKRAIETKTDNSRKKLYTLQVGAMKDKSLADEMVSKLKRFGYSAYVVSSESSGRGAWHKVRVGTFSSREDAKKEAEKFEKNEGLSTTVVEK